MQARRCLCLPPGLSVSTISLTTLCQTHNRVSKQSRPRTHDGMVASLGCTSVCMSAVTDFDCQLDARELYMPPSATRGPTMTVHPLMYVPVGSHQVHMGTGGAVALPMCGAVAVHGGGHGPRLPPRAADTHRVHVGATCRLTVPPSQLGYTKRRPHTRHTPVSR